MARFATAAEVGVVLQRTLSAAEIAAAESALDSATAAIKNHTRQTIEAVADEVIKLDGSWSSELWLPERPVTAVASLRLDAGAVLPASDYSWSRTGRLRRHLGHWGGPATVVEVTYSHGFTVIPADVKAVCLAAAVRALANPGGLAAESIDFHSVTYARRDDGGQPGELTDGEKALLNSYRLRVRSTLVSP